MVILTGVKKVRFSEGGLSLSKASHLALALNNIKNVEDNG